MLNDDKNRREATFTTRQVEEGASQPPSRRRQYMRHRVDLDVTVTSEHNFYAGFVENLSVGGVFIATHQLKPVGEKVDFSLNLPDDEDTPIEGIGEVRWVRPFSENSNVPPGMGLRFTELGEAEQRRIDAFLAQREPLFFDDEV